MRSNDALVRRPVSRLAPLRMARRRPGDDAAGGTAASHLRPLCPATLEPSAEGAARVKTNESIGRAAARTGAPGHNLRPSTEGWPPSTRVHGPIHPGPLPVRNKGEAAAGAC
ncbi:hypothetical protein HPB47_012381 [Ixodes persulcatus]|uniref:Uncharacterized protein n=1 Tax=Ixodes persulcatus TaxID=34615 RepID=A0AC60NTR3_IXOPE|nr:hypothetical protein HPB47_012381 [Ixodes persulcatus]